MKANFREEFLAASMTLDAANTDKLAMFAAEAKKSGIAVLPPSLNASEVEFLAEPPAPGQRASFPLMGEAASRLRAGEAASSLPLGGRRGEGGTTTAAASAPPASSLPHKGGGTGASGGEARGAIRYSLAALKNIGASAVASIVAEREAHGPFTSL